MKSFFHLWPLHKDDTLFQSGRPTGLNIYFAFLFLHLTQELLPLLPIATGRLPFPFTQSSS